MKIRNTAVLAAVLTVSGLGHTQVPANLRQRTQAEDALAARSPQLHKHVDPAEQASLKELDHTQEGRLNERQRTEKRQKHRQAKERIRSED